jgi:hypothetical protein
MTLRVLQFVKQLRRRLKPHAQGLGSSSKFSSGDCRHLESKALKSLAKGISRVSLHNKHNLLNASGRICKRRNRRNGPILKLQTSGQNDAAIQNSAGGKVHQYVRKRIRLCNSNKTVAYRCAVSSKKWTRS